MGTSWIANIIAALDQGRVARTPSANGAEGDIDLDLDEGRREFCAEVDYIDHLATLRIAPEIIDGEKRVDVRIDCPIEEDMVEVARRRFESKVPNLRVWRSMRISAVSQMVSACSRRPMGARWALPSSSPCSCCYRCFRPTAPPRGSSPISSCSWWGFDS